MVTVHMPPPSAEEVMTMMARWVARLYGVKVTVKLESATGESNTVIDGRPQTPPLDVCTDPDNCKRCKAPQWDRHRHEHAGLRIGA
jgi:hypothetical protein